MTERSTIGTATAAGAGPTPITIAGVPVGGAHPPLFLAEIGALFNQDIAVAERLIRRIAAASAGANTLPVALKGEILHDASVCLDSDAVENFHSKSGERRQERFRTLIERKILPFEAYRSMFDLCRACGLPIVMSVYDAAGADFAIANGVHALKVASSNITHVPLIRHVAALGVPMLIDTGRATIAEIDRAVRTAREAGATALILEHSPDGHPARPDKHNLRTIATLGQAFGVPVGLSDHFGGTQMMHVALGLGAALLERNIVEADGLLEQDHAFASPIAEVEGGLLEALYSSWLALGLPFRNIRDTEGLIATPARMGLIAKRPVVAGETLSADTVAFAFPCVGIGAENFDLVTTWSFRGPLAAGQPIRWSDVVPR